jgi:hypothetical protein
MTSGEIRVEPCNDVGEVERGNQNCQLKGKEGSEEEGKEWREKENGVKMQIY